MLLITYVYLLISIIYEGMETAIVTMMIRCCHIFCDDKKFAVKHEK